MANDPLNVEPRWRRYVRFWRRNPAADVNDELAFHFDERVREFMGAGMTRESAVERARERFGNVAAATSAIVEIEQRMGRRRDRGLAFDVFRQEATFALRLLRRSPAVSIACVVTIALGVGANGAMFSLADRLFVRPPEGVVQPGDIRRLYIRTQRAVGEVMTVRSQFAYPVFTLLDSALGARVRLAAYVRPDTMPLRDGNAERTVHGSYVSASYMDVLGVRPAFGRLFLPAENVMGSPVNVGVLSDRAWRRDFGADHEVLGRTVEINRQRVTIIGVAARGFDGTDMSGTDVWMPLASYPASRSDGTWYQSYFSATQMRIIGRLLPGTSDDWMASAATTVLRRTQSRDINIVHDSAVVALTGPILEPLGPSVTPPPEVVIARRLIGVTLIVLLIACANVASLLLARAMTRRREIAVRLALGVSRARLMVQLLVEGLLLSLIAGGVAIVVSTWAGQALRRLMMPETYWAEPVLDARVLLFTIVISILAGIAAAVIPAVQTSRPDLTSALRTGSRDGAGSAHRSRLRSALVVAQVALTVVLLYGTGLFVRSLMKIRSVDLGFDADRLVYGTAYLVNPDGNFVDWGLSMTPRVAGPLSAAAERLRKARDVEDVVLATGGPMGGFAMVGAYFADGSAPPRLDKRDPTWLAATPNYFSAIGARVARGRFFTDADRNGAPVMVINETGARFYWPHQDPLGHCVVIGRPTSPCATIVGVMRDSHVGEIVEGPLVQFVSPLFAGADGVVHGARKILVRARPGRTEAAASLLRRELKASFPTASLWIKAVSETLEPQLRTWRVGVTLFAGFGALALIIAAVGTYSLVSYSVTQRAHEMSVRVALGARAPDVLALVMSQGLSLTALGGMAGVALSMIVARLVETLLFETPARDAIVATGVMIVLMVTALIASGWPALRATRADPMDALRSD